jgi:hypothetical protein
MMIQFDKGLMIGLSALFCVSCVTTPQPQPEPSPITLPKKDDKPQTGHKPSINIPTTPSTAPVKPPVLPTIPEQEVTLPNTKPSASIPSVSPSEPVSPPVVRVEPEKPSVRPTEPVLPTKPVVPVKPPKKKTQTKPSAALRLPVSLKKKLSKRLAVPGGIAWVPLGIKGAIAPHITYKQRRVLVLHDGQQWIALIGIPLKAKVGRHSVVNKKTGKRYTFKVKSKKYKTQHIKLKNKRYVYPTGKDLKRIRRERQLIKSAFASPWRIKSTAPLPLMQPVRGRLSSPFGLRRFFNGQPRNPHTGLDIAVRQGTPIAAAASGRVLKTGHYFYTGKTVIIDHGQNLLTLYGHLNTITVSPGQRVKKGHKIGTVGKTGRATGPHLHWSVSLNQTLIDPKLVME